jgi:DNA polymerase-3 subunit delta'
MTFAAIDAQEPAVQVLRHALAGGRIGQSYLFVGPSGVGKQLAALALARAANCKQLPGEGCDQCETCRRIDQGVHPDVRVFAPRDEGNRNLPVEYLRSEVLPFAKFAPFEGGEAFLIFPQADVSFPEQHPEAANALLKTLEEPRAHVHFVLLSERPERLLATIRSRCQRVRFAALPAAVIERILERRGIAEGAAKSAAALARGRADLALTLSEGERAEQMLQWAIRVDEALAKGSASELLELAEALARSDERALVLESLAAFYRDVAACGLGLPREALAFAHRADAIAERARVLPPGRAAERVAMVHELNENLLRNANPEVALDGLLFTLSCAR